MRIIIVGGGKLGFYVARNMLERKYDVKLIEKDPVKCAHLADELDAEVFCGDGTEIEMLAGAGAGKADCLIAVTGSDQDNLVASQLAKRKFMVKKVIARANNPRNLEALRHLGVDIAVSSTEIITHLIEQEVDVAHMHMIATLNRGKAVISTITLAENSVVAGAAVRDIELPPNSLIVSILRGEEMIIPKGDTMVLPGDEIVAVCTMESQKALMRLLSEIKKK